MIKKESKQLEYPDYFADKYGDNYDKYSVANEFNDFFVNVGPDLARTIPDLGVEDMHEIIQKNPYSMFLTPVDETEVKVTVNKYN